MKNYELTFVVLRLNLLTLRAIDTLAGATCFMCINEKTINNHN